MSFKKLTNEGKKFIRTITKGDGNSLLTGRNRYTLPFSDLEGITTTFTSNALDRFGRPITTNSQLGESLIFWFDFYAKQYDIDANIIAAQAYQESVYKVWNYAATSTASGISQFIGITVYDTIIKNRGVSPNFFASEIAKITKNLELPDQLDSYKQRGKGTSPSSRKRARTNRSKLHQNIIDNPDLMIKAQCKLMRTIADRNNRLASNSLFAYNRGSGLRGTTYTEIIRKTSQEKGNEYIKEGIIYVERIFGYLGDKDNTEVSLPSVVKGIWFGYDIDFTFDDFIADLD